MQPVTITLNQRVVSGHADMTILEIAQESGIYIPTICHAPSLKPVGACRLCLVENEANGALVASCVTPIAPGMVINTNSSKVLEHRRNIVKMLLASHPDTCLVCDKGNRCVLHQIASEMGVGQSGLEKIPLYAEVKDLNPFIARDMAKCILCGKCIRACQEIVVEGALDYYQRGFSTRPATLYDSALEHSECTFCGTCLAMCPTGALTEKEKAYQGTSSCTVQSTCAFCGCGCSIDLEIKDSKIVRVHPASDGFPGQGALCVRGSFGFDYIHSQERLTTPLIKENGTFKESSWSEALSKVRAGLQGIKDSYGPQALAVYGSSRCSNEENYLLQRFARTILQTNNVDNSSSIFNSMVRSGLGQTTGFLTMSNFWENLKQTDVILAVGADPSVTAPQVGYALKRAIRYGQAKLILIDPRQTQLAFFAHKWLRPAPGSDLWLLNSIAQIIIQQNLLSQEFVTRQTEGFSVLAQALSGFSVQQGADQTGVAVQDIMEAASLYAQAKKSMIVFGSGVQDQEAIKAMANLALLTGNAYSIYPLQKNNNAQGACEMGSLPDALPGYLPVDDPGAREKYAKLWHKDIPATPGLPAAQAFSRGRDIPWRGLYLMGENPVSGLPGAQRTKEALSALDFLVVQDLFMTSSAQLADVVLPACSFAEKEGSFSNLEGRIGWLRQALPPPGSSLPDWEIIISLAQEMGGEWPYNTLQDVMNEIDAAVPLYEGYYLSEQRTGDEWLYWEERRNQAFEFLTGFPCFSVPGYQQEEQATSEEYPFFLFWEAFLAYCGSGTRSGKSWRLKSLYPENVLKINPKDAQQLNLRTGEQLQIISPHAQIQAAVEVEDTLPAGMLSLPMSFPGGLELFRTTQDISLQGPALRGGYVKLEREEGHG